MTRGAKGGQCCLDHSSPVNEARSHPDKGKSCCTSTQDYGIDVRCQWKNKGGKLKLLGQRRARDVNSKEIGCWWRRKRRGKEVTEVKRSSICSLPWQCHKTVMGEEVDRWQLGGERQEIEKEQMDRVGDWMSKPEGRAIAGWCIYRTESKNKRNCRAACGFVFLWVKSAVPQQIRNNTMAISLPTALHQHICHCPHICSVFPFDILPLFFNTRPSCSPPVTKH